MKRVIILRGIPGSGKSTYGQKMFPTAQTVSADQFMIDADGQYKFDPEKIRACHKQCFAKFIGLVTSDVELIVVDNTNIYPHEIAPYYAFAELFGYEIEIHTLVADFEIAFKRNLHGAPEATAKRMAACLMGNINFMPLWWKSVIIR